jgi:hypothetical protein
MSSKRVAGKNEGVDMPCCRRVVVINNKVKGESPREDKIGRQRKSRNGEGQKGLD